MDYAEIVLDGCSEWFSLLARVGCPSRSSPGALAVRSGVLSNTDNGIVVSPAIVDTNELEMTISWPRTSSVPASCVLTEAADTATLRQLTMLGLHADNDGNELGRSLVGYRPPPIAGEGYEVVEVATAAELMGGLDSLGAEWHDDSDRQNRHRVDLAIGLGGGSPLRHWVARSRNATVAVASSFRFRDAVVLARCGVDRAHRRRGIATALTAAGLTAAIDVGATVAVLSPSPDGYQLHRHLGFELTRSDPTRIDGSTSSPLSSRRCLESGRGQPP